MYDIIVVGGGPAGLTAALYGRRAGKSVLLIEKNAFGGQITWSPKVENFPSVLEISGLELADRFVEQVLDKGAEIELDEVTELSVEGGTKTVKTALGGEFQSRSVILATGAKPRKLGVEGEDRFIGSGISFCAVCDGEFYKGRKVAVIGGGNSALQEAIYLSKLCEEVVLIHRREEFRGDKKLVENVKKQENIKLCLSVKVVAFTGENAFEGIKISSKDGEERIISVDGAFIAIGHEPDNGIFKEIAKVDEDGYFDSDEGCKTESQGIFVAGDCRKKSVRQLTTAVADGAVAAVAACGYLDGIY
ncbi:MAG: FAD-dependent oxidoreductase [Oscillospiraceae bacterium]|nr:FAD-dependent oxidoreductase [Oscillospiraceae bacterium]